MSPQGWEPDKEADPINPGPIDTVVLERFTLGIRNEVSREFANPPALDAAIDFVTGNLVFRLRQDIAAQPPREFEIRYPEDWWQSFRERWFPKWWIKRHPVRYIVRKMTAAVLYPKIAMPGREPRFYFAITSYPTTSPEGDQ